MRYAGERVQLGRPIGKFQAVQQQLALAAGEVAAALAAAQAATPVAGAWFRRRRGAVRGGRGEGAHQ